MLVSPWRPSHSKNHQEREPRGEGRQVWRSSKDFLIQSARFGVQTVPAREFILNVQGMLCPWPVLKARKRLADMKQGEILVVVTTDPAARIDVPHYCNESGNVFLGEQDVGNAWAFRIEKKGTNDAK